MRKKRAIQSAPTAKKQVSPLRICCALTLPNVKARRLNEYLNQIIYAKIIRNKESKFLMLIKGNDQFSRLPFITSSIGDKSTRDLEDMSKLCI